MSDLVAQGYDGTSVMSSDKNGVQAKIKEKYPNATYVHSLISLFQVDVIVFHLSETYLIMFKSSHGFWVAVRLMAHLGSTEMMSSFVIIIIINVSVLFIL